MSAPQISAWSAPGKLMLFGEYAVLEGHPAVALCMNARIRCTAVPGGGQVHFDAPSLLGDRGPIATDVLASPPDPALELLWPLITEAYLAFDGIALRFDAEFPHTWGLGSSSASSLAAIAAVWTLMDRDRVPESLFATVRRFQRRLQGAASGYDAATQLLGGAVRFVGGDTPQMERIEGPRLPWIVAYTGVKASTGDMIRAVRARHPVGSPIYARIGKLAEAGADLLAQGDRALLGEGMNVGHELLADLGAVPDELDDRIRALQRDPWVHGARMSGAGGGDCVLILARDIAGASRAARAQGFEVLPLSFEEQGLREES